MENFLDLRAPQWVDFTETCSPIRMQDFFEKTHIIHERIEDICGSASENVENVQPESQTDVTCTSTKAQVDLDIIKSTSIKVASPKHCNNKEVVAETIENVQPKFQMDVTCASIKAQTDLDIIKNTPIKIVSPKNRNNKEVVAETTYDQVLSDAMRKLELCKKPLKTKEALNKTTNAFKTPYMSKIAKSSRSVGYHSVSKKQVQSGEDSMPKSIKVNKNISMPGNDTSASAKETSVNHILFKQDKDHAENNTSKKPNDLVDDSKDKKENQEENNKEINKEEDSQDDVDSTFEKDNRPQSSNKHAVLTWYNHRRNLQKRRMSANKQYVSLAQAVSRFQNETPERFRTKSSKANNVSNMPLMLRSMQGRLKPTIPISPALVSKNRTRPVTVLSREEREKLEMEEMKKHPIKANPIPPNVLRGSRVMTRAINAAKKSMREVAQVSMTQSSEKACVTNSLQFKSPLHRDKVSSAPKNMVTKILVADPSGIVVEHEEIPFFGVPKDTSVTKTVTRIVPFSFEARNKDLQIKKEQRLKSLEEASRTKAEFHARPVPNFSKLPTSVKQQQNTKKLISPCPFSFDNRDKKISGRKEQLVKQVLEEDKRARMFRANPAPVFKPVMIRGRSKECLLAKDKDTKIVSEQVEDEENREPNVDSSKMKRENVQKASAVCTIDKQKAPLKSCAPKLNTDKRAKERYEFNEKMKIKEMEEDAKRQEAEKKRLESEKAMKAKLRKLAEVKAKPMPIYKPPIIIKATKELTNPQSPAFASKLRSKQT